jgi:hypothetical protein
MVERYPNHLAVYDESSSLTYRQLDLESNRLANALLAVRGTGPEIVSILMSPTAPAVVVPYWLKDYWELGLEGLGERARRKWRIGSKRLLQRLGLVAELINRQRSPHIKRGAR